MGRELQKKKNRSGIAKIRHKPKSKKNPVLANALIAANWNKSQTLSQNYRRLGLATKLNGATGGVDKRIGAGGPVTGTGSLDVKSAKVPKSFEGKETRVERDEDGKIIRVLAEDGEEEEEEEEVEANPKLAPLNDPLAALEDEEERLLPDQHHIDGHIGRSTNVSDIAEDPSFLAKFEADAARPGGKKIRKQSDREQDWCQRLYEKHGEDWEAMFKDAKLNIMQQSAGQLKKKVGKWLKDQKKRDIVEVED